jgi:hypothetical protein
MRTVVSFTAFLLICLALRLNAQDLQVIKDSKAAQYVGKNVEVRGLVVSVYTSKKGNTFLNFGAKYPNQTFIGYIPAGSEPAGCHSSGKSDRRYRDSGDVSRQAPGQNTVEEPDSFGVTCPIIVKLLTVLYRVLLLVVPCLQTKRKVINFLSFFGSCYNT